MKNNLIILLIIISFSIFLFLTLNIEKNNVTNIEKKVTKPKIELKLAHNLPENSALHEASVLYAKKIAELTNNKVKINIFPKQELGNDYQMIELASQGKIDIIVTPTAKMSVSVPSMQYADLPFLFPTRKDAYELLDGEVGKMILKDLNKIDLLGVGFWENGFKHFTANSKLISPKDFEGKKIRVMKSRIIMEQFKALGAQAIPIDFHSTKKALEDKVVDGQENPLVAIVNMQFHKVQSHLTISEHAYLPYVFAMSKKSLQKMPIEIQNILTTSLDEITKWEREETQRREKEFLETIKNEGVKIHYLTKEEKEVFRKKTKYIIKMYEKVIGSHIISKTEEILNKKYAEKEDIYFGLDVNLSIGNKDSGLSLKRGVELAIDEINSNGGLLGKRVNLLAKDNEAITTKALKNFKEFSENENVKVVIGGKKSSIISKELEDIQKSKKPYFSPWASADKIVNNGYKENYVFRVSTNNKFIINKLLNESLKEDKNPIIVVENSIWGRGALELIKQDKKEFNFLIINQGQTNFSNLISQIKQNNIKSMLMVLNTLEASNILKTLNENKIKMSISSHWGILGGDFYEKNKEYLTNIDLKFIQSFSFYKNKSKKAKEFGFRYIKKYAENSIFDILSPSSVAQAYDSTMLIAQAIKDANSFDGEKIKDALENLKEYNGLIKKYIKPFSKTDHEALEKDDFFFAKYNEEGKVIPIGKLK
jgi:tripartite ATP-independent transporter DctP family solute receptor